jgi:hypothetical protein
MSRNKTADFLSAMTMPPAPAASVVTKKPARAKSAASPVQSALATKPPVDAGTERHHSRADKKHFGGYLDAETLEIAAVLRVRLKLDNSELIKLALEELDRSHRAKRAFGDA